VFTSDAITKGNHALLVHGEKNIRIGKGIRTSFTSCPLKDWGTYEEGERVKALIASKGSLMGSAWEGRCFHQESGTSGWRRDKKAKELGGFSGGNRIRRGSYQRTVLREKRQDSRGGEERFGKSLRVTGPGPQGQQL